MPILAQPIEREKSPQETTSDQAPEPQGERKEQVNTTNLRARKNWIRREIGRKTLVMREHQFEASRLGFEIDQLIKKHDELDRKLFETEPGITILKPAGIPKKRGKKKKKVREFTKADLKTMSIEDLDALIERVQQKRKG